MGRPIFPNSLLQTRLLTGLHLVHEHALPAYQCLFLLKHCAGLRPQADSVFEREENAYFPRVPPARLRAMITIERLSMLSHDSEALDIYTLLKVERWGVLWTQQTSPPGSRYPFKHLLVSDPMGDAGGAQNNELLYFNPASKKAGYVNANQLTQDIQWNNYAVIGCRQLRWQLTR